MKSTYDLYWDEDTRHPSITLTEYIKLHIISLEQDIDKIKIDMADLDEADWEYVALDYDYNYLRGQVFASAHILSVAYDILGIQPKETSPWPWPRHSWSRATSRWHGTS